ncbi:MAG: chloride channel protein, partial [Desulfovibrio sp.]|nr:chloride channel protein [Desulfovibrio sp.]
WNTILVGLGAGFVGVVYAGLLRRSLALYARGRHFPVVLRPLLPFLGAALMLFIYPQATGEGLSVFTAMETGALASTLRAFLCAKLLFTAFCYGSGVPAGVMVPVLALGGVAGGLCAMGFAAAGIAGGGGMAAFITMGMAAAFAAAEHAPLTSIVLVLEMTGAYAATPGLLVAAAVAVMVARLLRARPV